MQLPRVDWSRTSSATAAITFSTGVLAAIAIVDQKGEIGNLSAFLSALTAIGGIVGLAYWIARTSRASGFIGSVLFGLITSIVFAVMIGSTGGVAEFSVAVLVSGTVSAGAAGIIGYRRNPYRLPVSKRSGLACSNCGEHVSMRAPLYAATIWVQCPNCESDLVGDRLVQLLAVLETLVVGAVALAGVYGFVITTVLGRQVTVNAAWVLPTTLIAVYVVGRLLRAPLAPSLGSYRQVEKDRRAPSLLRGYLLAAGVASIGLLTVMTAYAGFNAGGETVLISSAFVPFLLLYPIFERELSPRLRTAATATLLLWSGAVMAFFVVFASFGVYSFPREQMFRDDLRLSAGRLSEYDAWNDLISLNEDETTDRETFLTFFAENVVSVPDQDYKVVVTPYTKIAPVVHYSGLVTEELEAIEALLSENDISVARSKYLRLWSVANNMASGNPTLIQSLARIHRRTPMDGVRAAEGGG